VPKTLSNDVKNTPSLSDNFGPNSIAWKQNNRGVHQ